MKKEPPKTIFILTCMTNVNESSAPKYFQFALWLTEMLT